MRLVTLFLMLFSFMLTSCEKSEEVVPFEANYKGQFVRMTGSPLEDPIVANVTLNFTENTFAGSSDVRNYPAICKGNFTITQSKINVVNSCVFTADFDWTYIFQGEYNYEQNGDQLRIWREYPDGKTDIYTLRKEP